MRYPPKKQPKLLTVKSRWNMQDKTESANCPFCEYENIAKYDGKPEKLIPFDTCNHFSDLVSTGGLGVGFMFLE